jgi:flagellin
MALNSIITNSSAQVALASLDDISSSLASTQKAVSTGYIVADASDNGAAFAVAQNVRSTVSALTAANQELGNTTGLLNVTTTGLTDISNTLTQAQALLVHLSSGDVQGDERAQYISEYNSLLTSGVGAAISNSNYAGASVIGNTTAAEKNATFGSVSVAENELGDNITITTFSGSALLSALTFTSTQLASSTTVQSLLATGGTFTVQSNDVGTALNTYGNLTNLVNDQVSFNTSKISALQTGLGALVDANEAQESATLEALQTQQQLATSALSVAEQTPSLLTKLIQ